MQHEGAPLPATPERRENEERARSPFDLEKMEPRQIAALVTALGAAYHTAEQADRDSGIHDASPRARAFWEPLEYFMEDLEKNGAALPNALDVYLESAVGEASGEDSRNVVAHLAPDLLRRNLDNPEAKKQIIESLVAMAHGSGLGQEAAEEVMAHLVWENWLDEPTAVYLNSFLPDHFQRW